MSSEGDAYECDPSPFFVVRWVWEPSVDARRFCACVGRGKMGLRTSECADVRLKRPERGNLSRFMMGENKLNDFPAFPGIKGKSNNLGALL